MIDPHVPAVTALALAALLIVALALLMGHAVWLRVRDARLARPLAAARAAVARAVDGHGAEEGARVALHAVPMRCRITVLADLAPTLRGAQRERLEKLAGQAGVLGSAQGWAQSRRWWRRLHVLRLATLLGGGVGTLEPLIEDKSWEVRAEAAQWAALHPARENVERLLTMLNDPKPLPRFAAKDALRRIGRPMAAALAETLETTDGAAAAAALEVAVSVASPELVPMTLRLCSDDLPETRMRAAMLLGALGGGVGVDALLSLLDDAVDDVRAAAAWALGQLSHWPAAGGLAAHMRDPAWEVRRNAALALRRLGSPGIVLLRRALDSDDRYAADMAQQILDLPDTADEAVLA